MATSLPRYSFFTATLNNSNVGWHHLCGVSSWPPYCYLQNQIPEGFPTSSKANNYWCASWTTTKSWKRSNMVNCPINWSGTLNWFRFVSIGRRRIRCSWHEEEASKIIKSPRKAEKKISSWTNAWRRKTKKIEIRIGRSRAWKNWIVEETKIRVILQNAFIRRVET